MYLLAIVTLCCTQLATPSSPALDITFAYKELRRDTLWGKIKVYACANFLIVFLAKMGTIVFAAAQIFRSINHKSVRNSRGVTQNYFFNILPSFLFQIFCKQSLLPHRGQAAGWILENFKMEKEILFEFESELTFLILHQRMLLHISIWLKYWILPIISQ